MPVTIENPQNLPLHPHEQRVLRAMFADYHRLIVRSLLAGGLSGSHVYLVRPVLTSGPELPAVVKIDLYERIEQEWEAYNSCVRNRLSKVAEIRDKPVNPPGCPLSGVCYPLAGGGIDDIVTLHEFLVESSQETIGPFLENRLFRYFVRWWHQAEFYYDFNFRAAYNDFFPLDLVINCTEAVGQAAWLHPESIDDQVWEIGKYVQVTGFKVVKLLREKNGLSLDVPEAHKAFRLHVYGVEDVSAYEIGQVIQRPFTGLITETRQRQLSQQVQRVLGPGMDLRPDVLTLPNGQTLPNPLVNWQKILSQSMDVRVGCVHGDLNLKNVLVEQDTELVHLIDFAKSGRDHVLRDLLHLEMAVVNRILAETMTEGETAALIINDLYQRLHCAVNLGKEVAPPTGQEKVFTILRTIRQTARPLLYRTDNWHEYYNGLFIYLLGSLRYGDLDQLPTAPRPKELAFWGAATILDLMDNEVDCSQFVLNKVVAVPETPDQQSQAGGTPEAVSSWDIDRITADWQANPLTQRLIFFNILKTKFSTNELGELALHMDLSLDDLPPGSRSVKAQELIGYFERRGQIRNLLEAAANVREDIPWG